MPPTRKSTEPARLDLVKVGFQGVHQVFLNVLEFFFLQLRHVFDSAVWFSILWGENQIAIHASCTSSCHAMFSDFSNVLQAQFLGTRIAFDRITQVGPSMCSLTFRSLDLPSGALHAKCGNSELTSDVDKIHDRCSGHIFTV